MEASRNPVRWLLRVPVPWVFVLGYLIGIAAERVWPVEIAAGPFPQLGTLGGLLFFIGALIAGWGLLTFYKARTTTVPGEKSAQLVTWGPYRKTRNPMYVGLTFAYLGEAALLHQIWPVFVLPLVLAYVNWVVIPLEESKLKEVFGEAYEDYRARVGRWV